MEKDITTKDQIYNKNNSYFLFSVEKYIIILSIFMIFSYKEFHSLVTSKSPKVHWFLSSFNIFLPNPWDFFPIFDLNKMLSLHGEKVIIPINSIKGPLHRNSLDNEAILFLALLYITTAFWQFTYDSKYYSVSWNCRKIVTLSI